MQILRPATTGMCFGVRDALKKIDTLDRPDAVTIHGQLVHNETVLVQLGARGFRMVGESDRAQVPVTPTVLITAHGISDTERRRLASAGKQMIDTTCPLVTRVHQAAQSLERDGYFVLVIGRPNHVEVRGIVEDLSEYEVIEHEVAVRSYPFPRIGVVCQTTTAPATVAAVRLAIVFRNPHAEIRFQDTTCAPTRENQRSLDELLPQVDAMVVVGGNNSNNTRELVARCESAGKPTFHVQSANGLKPEWLIGYERVGVAAGTSTLDETLEEVGRRLEELTRDSVPVAHRQWFDTITRSRCNGVLEVNNSEQLEMQVGVIRKETDPKVIAQIKRQSALTKPNWDWLHEHYADILRNHGGKYICVSGAELFVGDTREQVLAEAERAHPGDEGRVEKYIHEHAWMSRAG